MSDYHKLSLPEKRAVAIASVRETAVSCPICDTQVMPIDLPVHIVQRCPGPREPGVGAKWVTFREALAFGVSKRMLSYWTTAGRVRIKGTRGDRHYLVRDLALCIANQRVRRRR